MDLYASMRTMGVSQILRREHTLCRRAGLGTGPNVYYRLSRTPVPATVSWTRTRTISSPSAIGSLVVVVSGPASRRHVMLLAVWRSGPE